MQDISPSSPFVVVPASFEYMYFMELLPLSIDNRGGGRNHVKSVLSKFFGVNSYSVSSFLRVVVTENHVIYIQKAGRTALKQS